MQSLISDLEKTQSKVLDQRKEMLNKIDALIGELTNAKINIQRNIGGDETQVSMSIAPQLNELPKKGTDVVKKIINQNKVYYEHLSKKDIFTELSVYGKQIAKELTSKPEYEQPLFKEFELNKPVLNQTIAEHMYRSGCYQAGEVDNGQVGSVKVDANGDVKMEEDVPIKQENSDDQSSIIQMNVNEAEMDFQEVGLSREQALQEIQKLDKELQIKNQKLLKYSQQSMRPFHSKYSQEIHHLMGSLIYLDQLAEYQHTADKSPSKHSALSPHVQQYQDLIKQDNWLSLEQQFIKDYCKVQGLSSESSLLLITKASMLGLPILTKAIQKMNLKNEKAGFSTLNKAHNELPIEIDLGNEFKFHDIFICPVSKEISHSRDNNPFYIFCSSIDQVFYQFLP